MATIRALARIAIALSVPAGAAAAQSLKAPALTPAPAGPYRVDGPRILDSRGRAYLIRGTEFPKITLSEADFRGDGSQFGPFSPTSFVTVRHRANMNAARFPVDTREYGDNPRYRARVREVVQRANRFELLAILEAEGPAAFWTEFAADFKDNPNAFFAASPAAIGPLRAAGLTQPVIVASSEPLDDPNIIYETTPRYAALRTGEAPWLRLAGSAPVLVNDLDPKFGESSPECAAFPSDPGAASELLEGYLSEFDARSISWTLSSFQPGKLIGEYRYYNWSKLDDGWICGQSPSWGGIAMILLSHLWRADPHGLFAVAHQRGGFQIARGAVGAVYGRILAEREMTAGAPPLPSRLGNISIRITDARGIAHLAPLIATGAGWAYTNFVVPANTAVGPAEVAVIRSDGTRSSVVAVVTDVSPALWTASQDGRGPVIAYALRRGRDGSMHTDPAWRCTPDGCRTAPIEIKGITAVRLEGTGFRYAAAKNAIHVTIDDVPVPIVSFGAAREPGRDYLVIRLPEALGGRGETDLVLSVQGEISNVVRINCGG